MENKQIIKIFDFSEIKEPISNYKICNNKIDIFTNKKNYNINYNLENEKNALELLETSTNLIEEEIKYNNKEIKSFKKFLIVIIGYALLFAVLSAVISSFLPLIFTFPSFIFGLTVARDLRNLRKYTRKLKSDLYNQKLNLKLREIDFNTNSKIALHEKEKQEKMKCIETKLNNLENSYCKHVEEQSGKRLSLEQN